MPQFITSKIFCFFSASCIIVGSICLVSAHNCFLSQASSGYRSKWVMSAWMLSIHLLRGQPFGPLLWMIKSVAGFAKLLSYLRWKCPYYLNRGSMFLFGDAEPISDVLLTLSSHVKQVNYHSILISVVWKTYLWCFVIGN